MSTVPNCTAQAPRTTERRAHPRRRLDQLVYIGFGPDTGGVLLDVSEGGLRCQIVGAVVEGGLCHLKFALPGRPSAIESDGQVVWSNKSRQGGGVRLLGLREDVRQQLQQWISGEIPSARGSVPVPNPVQTQTKPAVDVLPITSDADAVLPVQATPVTAAKRLPISSPSLPQPPAQLKSQQRLPLAIAPLQSRNLRATGIAVVAGCIVLGVAALALSNVNLARVTELIKGETRFGIALPAIAETTGPMARVPGASLPTGLLDENSTPPLPSDAAGYASAVANQPVRPEVPITKSALAPPARPVQRPPAVVRENRQRLAMALPRPRRATPRPPLAALPPPAAGELVAPPIALMEPQPIETRMPEMPQPVRPPTRTVYQQPNLIMRVEPVYSRYARDARLQGTVQISAAIGADGIPRTLTRVTGSVALADMAIEAVRQWRYHPALLNGQPAEAHVVINFNFQLR